MKHKATLFQEKLQHSKQISIIPHVNPDGDAIGSACALSFYLDSKNIKNNIFAPDSMSTFLKWLPKAKSTILYNDTIQSHKDYLLNSDLIIFVDHNSPHRGGDLQETINKSKAYKVMIDHHPSPEMEVDLLFSYPVKAATCCILFQLFKELNFEINKEIATCLYAGIMTDTGNFKHGNQLAEALHIAAKLIELGADQKTIYDRIYHTASLNKLRLLGHALLNKLELVPELPVGYITLSKNELKNFCFQKGDTLDIVNYPLTLEGIRTSALFVEKDDLIKISFRSKGDFDVNLLANTHFNGGGHKNASGGRYYGSLNEAVKKYIESIKEYYDDYENV